MGAEYHHPVRYTELTAEARHDDTGPRSTGCVNGCAS